METVPAPILDGAEKLAWLKERIAAGVNIYLSTYTRSTVITPKTAARWAAAGRELFKVNSKGSLFMASGRSWVCIDFTALNAESTPARKV